jgi:SAM-dependent methyltransferase
VLTVSEQGNSIDELRTAQVLSMLPANMSSILEIGARYGVMTRKLAQRFPAVTALDLCKPPFEIEHVSTVAGNVEALQFDPNTFDCVICTEVLEHVPGVAAAASEIARVSHQYVLVSVPYKQDTRVGRTTCVHCGKVNPPYGHINTFDENRLASLFPDMRSISVEYVGENTERTNALSVWFQDLARNPYGAYHQEEPCIFCGGKLVAAEDLSFFERAACRVGTRLYDLQAGFNKPLPTWIFLLLQKGQKANDKSDRCAS